MLLLVPKSLGNYFQSKRKYCPMVFMIMIVIGYVVAVRESATSVVYD